MERALALIMGLFMASAAVTARADDTEEKLINPVEQLIERYPTGSLTSIEQAQQVREEVTQAEAASQSRYDNAMAKCARRFFVTYCEDSVKRQRAHERRELRRLNLEAGDLIRLQQAQQRDQARAQRLAQQQEEQAQRSQTADQVTGQAADEQAAKQAQRQAAQEKKAAQARRNYEQRLAEQNARQVERAAQDSQRADQAREFAQKQQEAAQYAQRRAQERARNEARRAQRQKEREEEMARSGVVVPPSSGSRSDGKASNPDLTK